MPHQIKEMTFLNKSILVCGGSGFVGSNMLKALLPRTKNLSATRRTHKPHITDDSIHWHQGDLTERTFCQQVVKQENRRDPVDIIIQCAANTSGAKVMKENPQAHVTENILMNTILLEEAAKANVPHFVFISSSTVYPPLDHPAKEEEGFLGDPAPIYFGVGWMKRNVEKLCEFYQKSQGMKITIVRPGQIAGKFCHHNPDTAHMLPAIIHRVLEGENPLTVWGSPQVSRDFLYIEDFVEGVMKAIQYNVPVINLASGNLVTNGEIVNLILKHTTRFRHHKDLPVSYDESQPTTIEKREIDITLADKKKLLPSVLTPLDTIVKRTVDWIAHDLHNQT